MNSDGTVPVAEGERAWNRARAVARDDRWHRLSVAARRAFLEQTKGPSKPTTIQKASFAAGLIDADVLDELLTAGFVELEKTGTTARYGRGMVPSDLYDFAQRIRAIHRYHILGPQWLEGLLRYCRNCFQNNGELAIRRILQAARVHDSARLEALLDHYVTSHHWPIWTVEDAESPLAETLADALIQAPRPTPLTRLPKLLSRPAAEAEAALWSLLQRLAVFEDLDPKSLEVVVDFLPVVRERLVEATRPRERPPLVEVAKPRELGPHAGLLGADLRVFLLEVIAQSPRLRQDRRLFAKEEPRFLAAFPAWPDWLVRMSNATPEARLDQAYEWAVRLGFVDRPPGDDQNRLALSPRGQSWMASDVEDQYRLIYDALRSVPAKDGEATYYSYHDPTHADALFLGVAAVVRPARKTSYWSSYDAVKPEDRQALRDAIDRAWGELPSGLYVTVESALAHLAFGRHNPLTLGKTDASGLSIEVAHTRVPNLDDKLEQTGRDLLRTFLVRRLLPFDAMLTAVGDDGRLCIARTPRLDGYFGRKYEPIAPAGSGATRVIVQPDFSVMVIGIDPAPAVALSPFCDRHQGQAGQGAMIFKLTRESVVRAVAAGMKPDEIVARLNRHASVAVPANVLAEVRDWARWTRLVNVRPLLAIRCPDRETVARVVAALGRRAEALGDTLVGLEADKLTAAERAKLQAHGIIITRDDIAVTPPEPEPEPEPAPEKAKGRRGRPRKVR